MISKVTSKVDYILLKKAAELIIEAIGESQLDPNFAGTPDRFARAFSSFFMLPAEIEQQMEEILSVSFPTKGYRGMVFCTGIEVVSWCPHHLLPVLYDITIGYIPSENGKLLGASKLARLADILCKRAVLQEDLTNHIASSIEGLTEADGVAVVVNGRHDCMRIRGIKQMNSVFKTSEMRGSFKTNPETREEFFHLIANGD